MSEVTKMLTIMKLSENGFLTESGWMSIDKFKCSKELFNSLKVGDKIDSLKTITDKSGTRVFVTDFIVLSNKDSKGGELLQATCSTKVSSPPTTSLDRIMYGQAVNLAFDIKNRNYTYSNDDELVDASFDLADKIYIEYSKRVKQ